MRCEISTDKSRLDAVMIHRHLHQSYWASGIPMEIVTRSIEHSLCFGVYLNQQQIGFARVISDYATFAYLCDVFIAPEYQGRGYGKALMGAISAHPDLQTLRRFMLATKDAHDLYTKYGFTPIANPERLMHKLKDPAY